LLQEACASHGITLTKAKTIIWSTPTYNYEIYTQLNARIKRIGQNNKTNIIRIIGRGTEEENVYCKLDSRINKNNKMLEQFI
jgi:SNF2 family DNA or RNA helicase